MILTDRKLCLELQTSASQVSLLSMCNHWHPESKRWLQTRLFVVIGFVLFLDFILKPIPSTQWMCLQVHRGSCAYSCATAAQPCALTEGSVWPLLGMKRRLALSLLGVPCGRIVGYDDAFIEEGLTVQTVILALEGLRRKNCSEPEATKLHGKFQVSLGCRMIHSPKKWVNEWIIK